MGWQLEHSEYFAVRALLIGCGQPLPMAQPPNDGPSLIAPTYEGPTTEPSSPVGFDEPTSYPAEPSQFPTEQTSVYPSDIATITASDQPLAAQRWPSVAPTGPLPNDPDQAKIDAMACHVRGAALILFPSARFAPASEPPMQVVRWAQLDFATGWQPVYNVRAQVVTEQSSGMFLVQVQPLPQTTQELPGPEEEVRPLGNGKTAYIDRTPYSLVVRVTTSRSSIVVWCDGNMITTERAIALASAAELDIFG